MNVNEMMDIVLAQLVVQFRKPDTDDLCAMALMPGEGAPLDYAECGGMLWVRLITAFPSTSFPAPNNDISNCAAPLAYQLEVAVMRPSPIPDDFAGAFADLPDDTEHTDATHKQMADMEAMHAALKKASKHLELMLIGSYTPVGPVGGTVGGSWTVVVSD